MMYFLLFIITTLNLNFRYFVKESGLRGFYLNEEKVEGIDYLGILPDNLNFTYQTYRFNGMENFISYYQISVPLLSIKTIYFPFLLHKGVKINDLSIKLSYLKAKYKLFMDYARIWTLYSEIRVLDSIIECRKTLLRYKELQGIKDEGHFIDEITTKRELISLKSEKRRKYSELLNLLQNHGFLMDTPVVFSESMSQLLKIYQNIKDSLKLVNKNLLENRIDFEKIRRETEYLSVLPEVSYIKMHQFEGLSPTSVHFGEKLSGIGVSINLNPFRFIENTKNASKRVEELKIRSKEDILNEKLNRKIKEDKLEVLKQKIKLLNEVEKYYKKEAILYENGSIDIVKYERLRLYVFNFEKEVLMEFLSLITNKE